MPVHTTASSSTWMTSSRTRSDQVRGDQSRVRDTGFDGSPSGSVLNGSPSGSASRLEHIPSAPQGVDHRVATAVDLLAQVGHVQLDDVGPAAEVIAPHPVQD